MNKLIILSFFFLPILASAQSDLLILQKKGQEVVSYSVGSDLNMKTIYGQWFQGTITDLRHDSVYLNGLAFHYKEIAEIQRIRNGLSYTTDGVLLMIGGAGLFALGAANGALRGDKASSWYTGGGLIVGAAMIVGGFLLTRARVAHYKLGRRFALNYFVLNPNRKINYSN